MTTRRKHRGPLYQVAWTKDGARGGALTWRDLASARAQMLRWSTAGCRVELTVHRRGWSTVLEVWAPGEAGPHWSASWQAALDQFKDQVSALVMRPSQAAQVLGSAPSVAHRWVTLP